MGSQFNIIHRAPTAPERGVPIDGDALKNLTQPAAKAERHRGAS